MSEKTETKINENEAVIITKYLKLIESYYEGESYVILGVTGRPNLQGDCKFDQCPGFLATVGWQKGVGPEADMFEGAIYFQIGPTAYIETTYYI